MKKISLLLLTFMALNHSKTTNCNKEYNEHDSKNSGCEICKNSFYKKTIKTPNRKTQHICKSCPEGCLNCESRNICSNCKPNYILQEISKKTRMQLQQKPIRKLCKNVFRIKERILGNLTDIQTPQICSLYGCKNCNSNDVCMKCRDTHYPIFQGKKIKFCKRCEGGCDMCFSQSNCTACKSNYFLKENSCLECDLSCKRCQNSAKKCLSCAQGYSKKIKKSSGFECLKCSNRYCLRCKEVNTCEKCINGYELQNGKKCTLKKFQNFTMSLIIFLVFILLVLICAFQAHKQEKGKNFDREIGNLDQYKSFSIEDDQRFF